MVTTLAPSTVDTAVWQERCARPLTCTVQAPQRPAPQPYLVPVNPTWSRMIQRSGVLGSASTETCLSLSVNETMGPPFERYLAMQCVAGKNGPLSKRDSSRMHPSFTLERLKFERRAVARGFP